MRSACAAATALLAGGTHVVAIFLSALLPALYNGTFRLTHFREYSVYMARKQLIMIVRDACMRINVYTSVSLCVCVFVCALFSDGPTVCDALSS